MTVEMIGAEVEPRLDWLALTEALTDILREELDIDSDRIYVTYEEIGFWGWNGGNL